VILSIVDANAGERPIYCTQAPTAGGLPGLHRYMRCVGAAWRFQPDSAGPHVKDLIVPDVAQRNLVEVYRYRGFSDSALWLEAGGAAGDPGVGMFFRVREGFLLLARHYLDSGEPARARQVLDAMDERLPSWRFPSERNPAVRRLRRELGDAGVLPAGPDSSVAPGR